MHTQMPLDMMFTYLDFFQNRRFFPEGTTYSFEVPRPKIK